MSTDKDKRVESVKRFIDAIVDAAVFDAEEGVPVYDPRNSGERLIGRLNLPAFRVSPRRGDAKHARSLYTIARWLYDTEKD